MKRCSVSVAAWNQTIHSGSRSSAPLKWPATATTAAFSSDATTSSTPPPAETGTSSNANSTTTTAIAAVAVVSLALAAGAASGVFSSPTTKDTEEKSVLSKATTKKIDDPSAATTDTVKGSKLNEAENSRSTKPSTVTLPANSFVQASDFWETRLKQEQKRRQVEKASGTVWKDGLAYDDPSQDEPSECEICNTFRHGPCRPYQRAIEHCMDQHQKKQQSSDTKNNNQEPQSPTEACVAPLNRLFQECLRYHGGFYRLVNNYNYQDKIDPHEWRERRRQNTNTQQPGVPAPLDLQTLQQVETQLVDRAIWMQQVHVDWSHWQGYVQSHGWNTQQVQDMLNVQQDEILRKANEELGISFGPAWWKDRPIPWINIMEQVMDASQDADFSSALRQNSATVKRPTSSPKPSAGPYWQYLQEDADPILIPLQATCPVVDHKTGFPLLAAYVRDEATGRVLGQVTPPPPPAPKEEGTSSNQTPSSPNTEGSSSSETANTPLTEQFPFHIIPGWTESIRVCAVYQQYDDDPDNDKNDLAIVFRESPRLSLVDALSPDFKLLEHDPQRLADRFRLIRNYMEWSSQNHEPTASPKMTRKE